MRAIGYTRLISMENFRTPNFELVADILHWLVHRYDPSIDIALEIRTEEESVQFLKSIADAMNSKAQIKLNTKKLYSADGYAVKELLKISTLLYQAMQQRPVSEREEGLDLATGVRADDAKMIRNLASEVTSVGATIYDLLSREVELREARYVLTTKHTELQQHILSHSPYLCNAPLYVYEFATVI
jgi:clusterin-associated protein 1